MPYFAGAATHLVTNALDSGSGSLRTTISAASPGDLLIFDPTLDGATILLNSQISIGKNITIDAGSLTNGIVLSGNNSTRILNCTSGTIEIRQVKCINGKSPNSYNGDGGALLIGNTAQVSLYDCTFTSNRAGDGDGGSSGFGDDGNDGGAIYVDEGELYAYRCTFNGNRAGDGQDTGGYAGGGGDGGAIAFYKGTVVLDHCTISSNFAGNGGDSFTNPDDRAGSGGSGGGLHNSNVGGTYTIKSCTITGNSSGNGGAGGEPDYGEGSSGVAGGLLFQNQTSVTFQNTIIAKNVPGGPYGNSHARDTYLSGNATSLGHNLVGSAGGGPYGGIFAAGVVGDIRGTTASPLNPLLGSLADNGGNTQTHALLTGSPALHAGVVTSSLTDQRSSVRVSGIAADIGSYEYNCMDLPGDYNCDMIVNYDDLDHVLANLNGGVVDQEILNVVLDRYWPNTPWMQFTETVGLGTTNVDFSIDNNIDSIFSVEVSTNLVDWAILGPALPYFRFADTNAITAPTRHYRLVWP